MTVRKTFMILFLFLGIAFLCRNKEYAKADVVFIHNTTGYAAYIDDDADLLSEEEEAALASEMEALTEYENIAFCSTYDAGYGTASYARSYTEARFSGSSGSVFLIDMGNRMIYIDSYGAARKRITTAYANTITDNIYRYASDADYYKCASVAFSQMHTLFEGGRIAQPMKYISNLLLALVLALLINFLFVMHHARKHKPSHSELLRGLYHKVDVTNGAVNFINQTKRYNPPSSSSSGGGGRSGGGGGGGGGHSGGGHSF